jgi:hypothetical protein
VTNTINTIQWFGWIKANLTGATFTPEQSSTNLSNSNTGDETDATIKTKLSITTLSEPTQVIMPLIHNTAAQAALITGLQAQINS